MGIDFIADSFYSLDGIFVEFASEISDVDLDDFLLCPGVIDPPDFFEEFIF